MEFDCVKNFGALKGSKHSILKRFKSFAIKLRDMPPELLPPLLADNFATCPPGNPDHHHLKVLAAHDNELGYDSDTGRGARVRPGKSPPPSSGTFLPASEPIIHSGGPNKVAAPEQASKKQAGGPTENDIHESIAAAEKSSSKGNATNLRDSDGTES
ncbi:hypothetical protein IFR04_011078 [Cadophora malorum]|uniref:Uncharacterized protein n=1 Tax=Cadophora malorum TaxID=108018 RepID=A0A8H7TBF8_9HELO|nr:hypothetical protein IFR04_011078 [Cadophora malorum]